MAQTVRVRGLREMNRAFTRADKDLAKDVRSKLKDVAEPVARDAEAMATREITNIGPRWSQMRVGATQRVVYVAPKQRRRGGSPRRNLAGLLMDRAMEPALEANAGEIEEALGDVLDQISRQWGRR